jgi:polysaccharide deacetylase family sporulation protein PdaB
LRGRQLPVYNVAREDKKIALTIDAAWSTDKTEFILNLLRENEIKATFFLCGVWVKAYPDYVKQIAEEGHVIGNHSLTHPHMSQLGKAEIQKELREMDDIIESLTGKRCTLFRAPYGEYNNTVIEAVREIGYEPIQWNRDTVDWQESRSASDILNAVLPRLESGDIILCHNNGFQIEQYLPVLIQTAKEKGFTFVTIPELLLEGATQIDANGTQQAG